jgi:hypothetical protein
MICRNDLYLTESPADLAAFPWPVGPDWERARAWWEPWIRLDPAAWVANAPTRLHLLRVGDAVLPVTVDDPGPGRGYVVSPWAQYVAYAGEEISKLPSAAVRFAAYGGLALLRPLLAARPMDRVVQVNNGLFSTNLWPGGMAAWVGPVLELLKSVWPDRAVVFRSVEARTQSELAAALKAAGVRLVFSRVVTFQEPAAAGFWKNRQLRIDRKKWFREGWQAQTLGPGDLGLVPDLHRFYGALYLEKYSRLNPDFTPAFFEHALRTGFLSMELLRDPAGQPAGCWGWWARNGVMTQPIFGYDPAGPWGQKPYAALSLRVLEVAAQEGLEVNASGGAGRFKQQRGGVPVVEWHGVADAHLPWRQRVPWAVLNRLAGPRVQEWFRRSGL